jgi:hypothetical protein
MYHIIDHAVRRLDILQNENTVRTYSTTSGRQSQVIPHPRPVTNIAWRHSQASSRFVTTILLRFITLKPSRRDDLILYTITSDSTLRIYLPILDSPQRLQLHASLDLFSSLPFSVAATYSKPANSSVFWLDREIVWDALNNILKDQSELEDARSRRIKEIIEEGWDLFLRVLEDGSVVITAVAVSSHFPHFACILRQFFSEPRPQASNPPQAVYPTTIPPFDTVLPTVLPLPIP